MLVRPDIAFVAEAPGETEIELGRPLVGKSGEFLRRVIRDIGIDEDQCYFTNMCVCHQPDNKPPTSAMAKSCLGSLVDEIVKVKPKLVMVLGTTSSKYFARFRQSIMFNHGSYQEITLRPRSNPFTVGVVSTYHPAGVLREPDRFRDFVAELEYAKSIIDGLPPIIQPPYENYRYYYSQSDFMTLLEMLREQPLVALDLETQGENFFTGRILCAGFSWERETAHVLDWALLEQNFKNISRLNDVFEYVNLSMHNGIFDFPFLHHNGLTNSRYYLDTMVAHALLDERQGTHGLERLATYYYRAPDYKREFRESAGLGGWVNSDKFADAIAKVPKAKLFAYNAADTDYTWRLTEDLPGLLDAEGLLPVLRDIEMPSSRRFTEFLMSGLLVDRVYLEKVGKSWYMTAEEVQAKMDVYKPGINPNSSKQLAEFIFDELKLEPFGGAKYLNADKIPEEVISACIKTVNDPEAREYWTSKRTVMSSGMKGFGGEVKGITPRSTSAYHLYWLRQQHEFPDLVLQYRFVGKRKGLYYDGFVKHMYSDGRIRPKYDLVAARTGRKQTHKPAIHNFPRGDLIYKLIIPDPGWCLIHADYSQAEMRIMAHLCHDPNLIRVLKETDPHTTTAIEMFHLSEEDLKHITKAEMSNKRIAAKMITYGLPYGRSPQGLAPQLGITVGEAKEYSKAYFDNFPLLKAWIDETRDNGVATQIVINLFGRRRRFPLITGQFHLREVRRQMGNFPIQSTSNDLTLLAYCHTMDKLQELGIPYKPGAHIHDSVNFSVPIPFWRTTVQIIVDLMAEVPFETDIEFPVECEVGDNWGNMITVHKRGEWVRPKADEGEQVPKYLLVGWPEEEPQAVEQVKPSGNGRVQSKLPKQTNFLHLVDKIRKGR